MGMGKIIINKNDYGKEEIGTGTTFNKKWIFR